MEVKATGTPEEIAKLLQAIGSSKKQFRIKGNLIIGQQVV